MSDATEPFMVKVSGEALLAILRACNGPSYLMRELQVIRKLGDSPIDKLIEEYNSAVKQNWPLLDQPPPPECNTEAGS